MAFGLAVIKPEWVHEAWEQRDAEEFSPIDADFTRPYKVKAFEGQKICFVGFATEEHQHMIDVLTGMGGIPTGIDDPECSHVVSSNHFCRLLFNRCCMASVKLLLIGFACPSELNYFVLQI